MAATNEVHPPVPSQQALLSLERSRSPFPEQLDEASRILGVDFGSLQSPPPAPQRAAAVPSGGATAAKSDWVLRWLLNKLRASGESGAIIRSNVRAWQLLRHVVRSLPTSSAARSLNAHGFLQILRSALDEINVACATLDRPRAGQSPRDVKPVTQGLDKIGSTAAADSSSTAVDSPEDVPLRSSRKRKRSKSTTVEQEPVQPTAQRHCDLQLLTSALLDVVTLIVDCFGGSSDTAQTPSVDYSKEHMKSVLRSNPDDAGNLVGSSLRLLHQLFRNNRCQPFDSAFFSVPSWALAVNAIWQNRSVNIDDIDGNIGHDAFSSHCLRPGLAILRLHQRNITVGVGADEVVAVLERLMSRHIIAPGRTSFVESITTSASDLTIENLFEAGRRLSTLLEPLRVGTELAKGSSQQLQGASMTFEDSLDNSLMFDLAFRSSPLLRRSKVAKERLWIETVFVVLLEAAGIKLSAEELPPLDDDHSRVLESLLRIAVDRGVALSTTTLQLVTIRCTRLFSQEPNWRLLELIIQLDGDVFLAPLRDGALRTFCESPSKILVDPLFARLTAFAKSEADVVSDADRGLVQMKILIPLVDAFAHARKSIDFLACWHRELTQLEEARLLAGKSENKSGLTITILEDALLIDKLQRQLLKSIEIQDLIKRMEQDVSTVDLPEAADVQTKARSFASLVLLDACHPVLVQSWNGESLHELIFPMFRVVMKNTISDTWSQSHRWRLWRVLATIQELCPDFSSSVASRDHTEVYESYGKALNMGQETFKATVASITGLRQSFERNIRTWDLFEIFRFVSSSVAHLPRIHEQSKANISEVYQSMIQDSCELLERSSEASDETGRMGDSNLCLEGQKDYRNANQQSMSWKPLCVAFATEIFLRHPEILILAPSTDRRRLLRLCYSRAGVSALASLSEESGPIVTMGDVWTGTVTNNLLLNCVELKDDLVDTLINIVEDSAEEKSPHTALAERSLLALPCDAFRPNQRAKLLGILLQKERFTAKTLTTNQQEVHMCLRAQLIRFVHSSAQLVTCGDTLWPLAASLRPSGKRNVWPSLLTLHAFRQLVSLTLINLSAAGDEERNLQCLRGIYDGVSEFMGSSSTFLISHDFATLTLIQEVFSTFWRRASALQGEGGHPDIDLRSKYLSILSDDIRSCKDHGKAHEDLQLLVRAVSAAPGLNTIRKGDPSFEPLKKIVKNLEEVLLLTSDGSSKPPRNVSASGIVSSFTASAFKICFALEGEGGIVKQEQIVSLLKQVSYFDGAAVALVLQDHAKSLDESSKLDLLSSLLSDTWAGSPEGNQILWVRAIVSVIDSHSDETNAALSRSCNICCSKLPKAQSTRDLWMIADCLNMLLQTKPKVVSQWDVECALAAIALTASARGPHVSSRGADKIFARLCQLFFSVLMVHRLKLRRRYHIVLPALQALLRCLFVPGTWLKGKDSRARLLPPWISSKIHRLNASHGAAYARLLTSLCDPTVSSVTAPRSKAGEELTPARDMAKRIAGQHLPYLLVEYAQCQLQSRMLPEVKQSLLPGLFAIFDAANQDVLRMINSAMDSPSQAIYKGLYDEYKQSRAWEER